jgi:WD40 repeat protein
VRPVAVAPDGRYDISGSWDGTLEVWDLSMELKAGLETGHEARTLAGHADSVNAVAVTPDGRYAISGSADHTLKVWDLQTGQEQATVVLEGALWCVAVAPDGVTILVGGAIGNVYCLQYVEGNREAAQ